jgi:hypothetical protein
MSKISPRQSPHEEDTGRGELRKPLDWTNQPGQGADLAPPNPGHANPLNDRAAHEEPDPGRGEPGSMPT